MKPCLAILYSSILFSICLGFGFIRADDQFGVEVSLQEQTYKLQADKLVADISSDDACGDIISDGISLSDISFDEISLVEKPLTFGDKMDLMWIYLKIKAGEYNDSAVKHFLNNQRAYICGVAAATIVLALAGVYFLNQRNKKVIAPQN